MSEENIENTLYHNIGNEFIDSVEREKYKINELPFTCQQMNDFVNTLEKLSERNKFIYFTYLIEFRTYLLENKK